MVKQGIMCLCKALKDGRRYGIPIKMTRALMLPYACGISFPPIGLYVVGK